MARSRYSRPVLIGLAAILVAAALAYAFWPRPTMVDIGEVARGAMQVTIDEEGRTRVAEAYTVSTPVAGRLLRLTVHPGDPVEAGTTVVARMRPANPAALDVRTREQALAAVAAAEAALQVAESDLSAAEADLDLALSDLRRTQQLADRGTASAAALERVAGTARAAEAHRQTAEAAIAQRRAELQNAQAQLIGFDDRGLLTALEESLGDEIPIYAPADGLILRVMHENETTLPAGAPILEIGDVTAGLEIVVDLISSDAVQVSAGDAVIVEDWGGDRPLAATVTRIEPFGETRTSALGVEEQRVTVVARLDSPPDTRPGLGHGYRVEARIVVWEAGDALLVPSSALFRDGGGHAVFAVRDGTAEMQPVGIGRDNGTRAEVLEGLAPGDRVVLFPPPSLTPGAAVAQRVIE